MVELEIRQVFDSPGFPGESNASCPSMDRIAFFFGHRVYSTNKHRQVSIAFSIISRWNLEGLREFSVLLEGQFGGGSLMIGCIPGGRMIRGIHDSRRAATSGEIFLEIGCRKKREMYYLQM